MTKFRDDENVSTFLNIQLTSILGFPCDEIVKYVISMSDSKEQQTYLEEILNVSENPKRQLIISEFKDRNSIYFSKVKERNSEKKTRKKKDLKCSSQNEVKENSRSLCNCEASQHSLLYNCLHCGKIICEKEGHGPCLFCHQRNKNEARCKDNEMTYQKAESQKNKLLEFDKNSEIRTKVIDDENDYFPSNKWTSLKDQEIFTQREELLRNKKYESRIGRKIEIDLTGNLKENKDIESLETSFSSSSKETTNEKISEFLYNSTIDLPRPIYIPLPSKTRPSTLKRISSFNRVQEPDLQAMGDSGKCLSMHQPWASLLMAGIKRHEGRSWYSSIRGRLWIHAASKNPSESEILSLKQFYSERNEDMSNFPKHFPTSVLLGSVTVVDVLCQSEYRESFPNGESEEPYVYICENPKELLLKIPMSGRHKIFSLEPQIHALVKKNTSTLL